MTEPTCAHEHIVSPPPGKHLRICLDCCHRLIECSSCDAKLVARPDIGDSGWRKGGTVQSVRMLDEWFACPACQVRR